jgi:S1-C subfamily serine protease
MYRLALALVIWVTAQGSCLAEGLPDTVARIKASVVAVGTELPIRSPPADFRGTGFVVADGTLVVTNLHVISELLDREHRESHAVFFRSGGRIELRTAEIVARDPVHDLCLLKVSGAPLKPMQLATGEVREGARYAFTGFPIGMILGLTPVTHRGIVSAITPIVIPTTSPERLTAKMIRQMRAPYDVYQLDATAYPGNSGSPLYEIDTGKVVGVINSVLVKESKESALTRPTGISYAIPGRYVRELIDSYRKAH